MKRITSQISFVFLAILILSSFSYKLSLTKSYHLFKIERSKDANEIFYDVNINSDNKLELNNPLHIYWLKHTENSRIEPLTWIQKNYAYGIEYLTKTKNSAEFQFVSYKKRQFTVKKGRYDKFQVFTISNNKEVIVNRIYIQIDGGTFWFPKISRVELHAQDAKTNKELIEIINP